jgi:hypothetical protein
MAKATPQATGDTTTEYVVWYDAPDGARRSMNATDQAGVQQIIADLHADEDKRQLLAQSVGLSVPAHDYNITVTEVTTTTKPAAL